jgi:hypothetical protein
MSKPTVGRRFWVGVATATLLQAVALVAVCALLSVLLPAMARAQPVMGLHTASWHLGVDQQQTPGLYVRWGSWTAGGYRNSIGRASAYVTHSWRIGPIDVAVGAVTGYGYRVRRGASCLETALLAGWSMDAAQEVSARMGSNCRYGSGAGPAVSPLLALSAPLPAIGELQPRLTFIPATAGVGRSNVLHLSLERGF